MSRENTARLIDVAVSSLRKNLVPALSTPEARIHADLITRVLWLASFQLSGKNAATDRLWQEQNEVLDDIEALTGHKTSEIGDAANSVYMETRIQAAIPSLLDAAATSEEGWRLLDRLLGNERDFMAAQDPDIVGGSMAVFRGGRIETERGQTKSSADATPSAELLAEYFQEIRRDPEISVRDVKAIPGGFSKGTIFFDLVSAGGVEPLVMRKDVSVPFLEKSVINEFPTLQRLHAAGFPVAEPILLEERREPFGSPFMVSRRVAGTSDFQRWASDPALVTRFSRELAGIVARLHAIDLRDLGVSEAAAPKSAGDATREELDHWIDFFHRKRTRPYPLLDLTLGWLRSNIPAESFSRPARIVHGDIGFHNLMFDDQGVTAVLDWEHSHFGDPLEDLVYTRMFVEQITGWEGFKASYVASGGLVCPPEAEMFFGIWARVRNTIGCVDSAFLFDTALPDEIRFAVAGHVFSGYVELEAGEMLSAGLKNALRNSAAQPEKENTP